MKRRGWTPGRPDSAKLATTYTTPWPIPTRGWLFSCRMGHLLPTLGCDSLRRERGLTQRTQPSAQKNRYFTQNLQKITNKVACRIERRQASATGYSTRIILKVISPPGVLATTLEPTFLPINALPIGLSLLIRPFRGSASNEPTMV